MVPCSSQRAVVRVLLPLVYVSPSCSTGSGRHLLANLPVRFGVYAAARFVMASPAAGNCLAKRFPRHQGSKLEGRRHWSVERGRLARERRRLPRVDPGLHACARVAAVLTDTLLTTHPASCARFACQSGTDGSAADSSNPPLRYCFEVRSRRRLHPSRRVAARASARSTDLRLHVRAVRGERSEVTQPLTRCRLPPYAARV